MLSQSITDADVQPSSLHDTYIIFIAVVHRSLAAMGTRACAASCRLTYVCVSGKSW